MKLSKENIYMICDEVLRGVCEKDDFERFFNRADQDMKRFILTILSRLQHVICTFETGSLDNEEETMKIRDIILAWTFDTFEDSSKETLH